MKIPVRLSRPSRGFTLIELLITIAVIGLISSILFVALSGTREQARLGASKHFASGLDNALGGSPVGWWDFADCSGTVLTDKSGSLRNGTLSGGMTTANWSPDSPYSGQTINPCSLTFDGVTNYISVPTMSSVSGKFTISAWVKAGDPTAILPIVSSRLPSDGSFDFMLNGGNTIHSSIGNGTSWINANADANFSYVTGKWYNIAIVVTTTGYTIYADGLVKAQGTYAADVPVLMDASHSLTIGMGGNIHGTNKYFKGNMTGIHIFGLALSDAQVKQLYAEEKSRMDAVALGKE
jgi:prepilin-type N-terminal cleavage/methylation domain-containing protein